MKKKTVKTRELLVVLSLQVPIRTKLTPSVLKTIREGVESGGTAYDVMTEKIGCTWPEMVNVEFPWESKRDGKTSVPQTGFDRGVNPFDKAYR